MMHRPVGRSVPRPPAPYIEALQLLSSDESAPGKAEASNKSIWLYDHKYVNYLVNFTSDPIRCLSLGARRDVVGAGRARWEDTARQGSRLGLYTQWRKSASGTISGFVNSRT